MAQSALQSVESHWSKLVENLQASPKEFYASVEQALERRQVPDYSPSRMDFGEGGLLTAKREYLRIRRGKLLFDLCAAPFGTGTFFSWWLVKRTPRFRLFWGLVLLVGAFMLVRLFLERSIGVGPQELMLLPIAVMLSFVALGLIALLSGLGLDGPEGAVLAVPLLGSFYARVFAPETYYTLDTTLMFQSSVHAAVLEVIDGLLTTKGLRALSDDERKPVIRELLRA